MRQIFTKTTYFTIIFLIALGVDVFIKLSLSSFPYRYISKPVVMLMILGYYVFNQNEKDRKKFLWTILGICSFLTADIFLIDHLNKLSFIAGMGLFILAKVFYTLKFSHKADFLLWRLIPFLLVIFAYIAVMFSFIYDNLGDYFIPVLFYFFVSLLMIQMAYLRKNAVNFKSYMLVLVGVELLAIGESTMALKMFYKDIPYQDIITMLFYGIAQYLIITGILKEEVKVIPVNEI